MVRFDQMTNSSRSIENFFKLYIHTTYMIDEENGVISK